MNHEILDTVEDGVAAITLNRPDKLNALTSAIRWTMCSGRCAAPLLMTMSA
ncbi:MAG: hypothetical protein U5R48_11160 [Gammaproteobacteria bacterium]|nr:hypothetical protein [Gammaproteobacteria bacterium]